MLAKIALLVMPSCVRCRSSATFGAGNYQTKFICKYLNLSMGLKKSQSYMERTNGLVSGGGLGFIANQWRKIDVFFNRYCHEILTHMKQPVYARKAAAKLGVKNCG
jgi:hypothetical protein